MPFTVSIIKTKVSRIICLVLDIYHPRWENFNRTFRSGPIQRFPDSLPLPSLTLALTCSCGIFIIAITHSVWSAETSQMSWKTISYESSSLPYSFTPRMDPYLTKLCVGAIQHTDEGCTYQLLAKQGAFDSMQRAAVLDHSSFRHQHVLQFHDIISLFH